MADPTPRDLFLAILAMDSYNRGYDVGIKLPAGTLLGNATIKFDSSILKEGGVRSDIPAGFYAVAYEWNGEKVVSYRGTDNLNPLSGFEGGLDFFSYGIGIGQPFALTGGLTEQARLTIEFYRAVVGAGADPFSGSVSLTGHSLGGGLAGYAAMLYGKQATIFANMAFEASASVTRAAALVGGVVGLETVVYGDGPIYPTNRLGINAFAVTGELLTFNRSVQSTAVGPLESHDSDNLSFVELHSMALHTALIWNKIYGNQNWVPAAQQLWHAFYDKAVATKVTGASALVGTQDEVAVIDRAIAYSAIDSGVKPFGDTAIWSMFNDAGELGKVLAGDPTAFFAANVSTNPSIGLTGASLGRKDVKQYLADVLVQYAG